MNKQKIIAVFKSRERIADSLGAKNRTVNSWFEKGAIPADHHRDILECDINVSAPDGLRLVWNDLIS